MKTFYDILDVPRDADGRAIKTSYRKLVKKFHPDVNKGVPAKTSKNFEEITGAYNALIHPEKRKAYDQKLANKSGGLSMLLFPFRELRNWISSSSILRLLFSNKKVSKDIRPVDPSIIELSVDELLQRIIYSKNVHVQIHAVRALIAKGRHYAVHDLLRILYSSIHEDVKIEIVEGLKKYHESRIKKVLREIYGIEKSYKVREVIRNFIKV